MFIIKQSYNDKRKNREMRKYTWFERKEKQNCHNGIQMMQQPTRISIKQVPLIDEEDEEPFIFN